MILPYRHLNKRKISISLCYNGLSVSLFVIHGSKITQKINYYKNYPHYLIFSRLNSIFI